MDVLAKKDGPLRSFSELLDDLVREDPNKSNERPCSSPFAKEGSDCVDSNIPGGIREVFTFHLVSLTLL